MTIQPAPNITPFTYESHEIRTLVTNGEPWFVLADLARVFEIREVSRLVSHLDDGVRQTHPIPDALSRTQRTTIVSEAGICTGRRPGPGVRRTRRPPPERVGVLSRFPGLSSGPLGASRTQKLLPGPDFQYHSASSDIIRRHSVFPCQSAFRGPTRLFAEPFGDEPACKPDFV